MSVRKELTVGLASLPNVIAFLSFLDAHTKILKPGENQTITFYSPSEGPNNYYDRLALLNKTIGQIKAVRVTSFD